MSAGKESKHKLRKMRNCIIKGKESLNIRYSGEGSTDAVGRRNGPQGAGFGANMDDDDDDESTLRTNLQQNLKVLCKSYIYFILCAVF